MNPTAAPDQHEIPFAERRFRNQRFRRRGIFLLPSLFTVGNLLCGYYACAVTLTGNGDDLDRAAKAIGLAILFDSLDGRLARLLKANTDFGIQFDSLADVVSFGIAPALLSYSWGVSHLPGFEQSTLIQQIGHFGWWFCFAFVACCAWRLARFNVQGMAPGGSKYFIGMPTPAAAGMIAATIHAFPTPLQNEKWSIAWICMTLALAALMTSTIRFYSFKDIPLTRKQPSLAVVLLAILCAAIWRWSESVLFLMASSYAVVGVTLHLVRFVRHRLVSRTA
jgi:CDP-diacylglycerol--serine O-phosphatidyltransferase